MAAGVAKKKKKKKDNQIAPWEMSDSETWCLTCQLKRARWHEELSPPHSPHASNVFTLAKGCVWIFPSQPALMHLPLMQTSGLSNPHGVPSITISLNWIGRPPLPPLEDLLRQTRAHSGLSVTGNLGKEIRRESMDEKDNQIVEHKRRI